VKITDVESFTIEVPAEADAVEAGVIHQVGVTRIRTDGGLVGYGWGMTPQEQIEDGIKPLLLGQPAYQVEQFLAAAPDFVNWPYVEHALWDLVGKVAEQPIHRLWGAHKSKLRAYITCVWRGHKPDHSDISIEEQAQAAERYCGMGFKGIKVRAWRPSILTDVELCREIKRRVGDRMAVMFDRTARSPGWVWTYDQALQVARGLETAGADWLEEPFERSDFDGLSRLAAEVSLPITGGERERGVARFRKLIELRCFDIVQPDAAGCGGIWQMRKIGTVAESFGVPLIPHGSNGLGLAAPLQAVGSISSTTWMEIALVHPPLTPQEMWAPLEVLVRNPPLYELDGAGEIRIPTGPGLGIDVNNEAVEEYKVH
jgi:D-galactarolactone cycloisomerase